MNHKENSNQTPITDQITIIKKLKFEELVNGINRERTNPIKEPYPLLKKITKICNNWYEAKIPEALIKNVILQHHPRCQLPFISRMLTHFYNNGELVPKYGATVEETCKRLKKLEKQYKQSRPKCFQLIKNYDIKNFGHVILTQIPIPTFKRHKKIKWNSTSLIQFDGLHRLLSLYYPKKINFEYVNCFLASPDENLQVKLSSAE